ncbi:hypothetical protein GCM10011391_27110 [Pullulanibacillus camelliae]|uniref:DUF92 domain-containing protein n=1 Tax=Pullulanibacillus camelliae TaxID=1707096 RepID=A0A8J2YJR0_9BACL|nr:DUF92 domain-containing protein [Pullulanibacillus camelliae]GGE46834.1 hypothetical protein GCM10011391_27110 [Pullulanibacillus camelliae]
MLSLSLAMVGLILIGFLSLYKRWLTLAGALGMIIMGIAIVYAFHIAGLIAIFLFFISSNLLTSVIRRNQRTTKPSPEQRNLVQVLANGGWPLLAALGQILLPSPFWLGFYIVSITEATADTWASEVGSTLGKAPFHLRLWRRVPKGLSGAMTGIGSLAGMLGSLIIALDSLTLIPHDSFKNTLITICTIALLGWIGQFVDTLLGAYGQARYHCTVCDCFTDKSHHCDKPAHHVGGLRWMTNNAVNGLSSLFAGALGGSIFLFWIN